MSWMVHTGCRYHTQDTGYYCAAACAMMILNEIGVPYSQLDQDDLYDDIHSHNAMSTGWYGDPYGLRWVLNDRKPNGFYFAVRKPTTEAEGSREIVKTLHNYEVSPAALVFGCAHWLTIPGVSTDVEPVPGTNYTINGFWLHNPTTTPNTPPPPHNAQDICGTGGVDGTANQYVTYNNWRNNWFTGCDYDHPQGTQQFISVCDPKQPKIELPRHVPREFLADGRRLISERDAMECSALGIKRYLGEDKRVKELLYKTRPGRPLPVKRLDRLNQYYYLIPLENNSGVKAYSEIDARYGEFLGFNILQEYKERRRLPIRFPTRRLIRKILKQPRGGIEITEQKRLLKLFPKAVSISPTLVWLPCQESYSPSIPFYLYTVGTTPIYVRIDGAIFTALTTPFTTGLKGD